MGASESLQGCFSHNMDPVLHLLVSNRECLYIGASLSISWTTPCCMVLVSSYRSVSLAHFLPRVLDSLIFLSRHILLVCCHFLLDVLGYAHWSCSLFYFLHMSWAWYFIIWSICLFLFSTRYFIKERWKTFFHIHNAFERSLLSPYYFSLWSLGWKWIKDILL